MKGRVNLEMNLEEFLELNNKIEAQRYFDLLMEHNKLKEQLESFLQLRVFIINPNSDKDRTIGEAFEQHIRQLNAKNNG